MGKITKQQYEVALAKVEELLSLVDDSVSVTDSNAGRQIGRARC